MGLPKERYYAIEDILSLPDGVRAELIDGELYMMATPSEAHQWIVGNLHAEIRNHIRENKGSCRSYIAPFAVYLNNDENVYLEPDVSVICDPDKIDKDGCHGAPDWIIEVASPSSARYDAGKKRRLYQAAGVKEYWIVYPEDELVLVFDFGFEDTATIYPFSAEIPVLIYPGFSICIHDIL